MHGLLNDFLYDFRLGVDQNATGLADTACSVVGRRWFEEMTLTAILCELLPKLGANLIPSLADMNKYF